MSVLLGKQLMNVLVILIIVTQVLPQGPVHGVRLRACVHSVCL